MVWHDYGMVWTMAWYGLWHGMDYGMVWTMAWYDYGMVYPCHGMIMKWYTHGMV
jgi:hypothetical protein